MKATWNAATLADGTETVVVEGNHYFPAESVDSSYLRDSDSDTICPWKGRASYKSIEVEGQLNEDAAWYYPDPKEAAAEIEDRFAFWKGVQIEA
jgi:uncharacterized protein (DUF427 family)